MIRLFILSFFHFPSRIDVEAAGARENEQEETAKKLKKIVAGF
jgi:hypothetical protein